MLNKQNILLPALLAINMLSVPAYAEEIFGKVTLSATVNQQVANDEMNAVLYVEANEKNANLLTEKFNQNLDKALAIARNYNHVTARSNSYQTAPVYNEKQRIIGWTGRASIILNSKDFKQMNELIGKLQGIMQLENINFSLSQESKTKVEDELYRKVTLQFKQRAEIVKSTWQASSYQLLYLNIARLGGRQNTYYETKMVAELAESSSERAALPTEAGNTVLEMRADGVIVLK